MVSAWRSGRVSTLHFDPRFGPVDRVYLDEHGTAGDASKTGRIDKHPITSNEVVGFQGMLGLGEMGGMRIDRHRIAMTPPSGHLTLITSFTSDAPASRRISTIRARAPPGHADPHPPTVHSAPARCISWTHQLLNCVATGGDDGRIALWDVGTRSNAAERTDTSVRGRLLAILRTGTSAALDLGDGADVTRRLPGGPGVRTLALDSKRGLVIAGLANGDACVWEVDMQKLVADGGSVMPTSLLYNHQTTPPARVTKKTGSNVREDHADPVTALHYDSASACFVVVTARSMEMFSALTGELVVRLVGAHGIPGTEVIPASNQAIPTFGDFANCRITASAWERDREGAEGIAGDEWRGASVFMSGDTAGSLCTWELLDEWLPSAEPVSPPSSSSNVSVAAPVVPLCDSSRPRAPLGAITPIRTVSTNRKCAIQIIKIDPVKAVVGFTDSQVDVYDVISGRLLKSMPAFRNPTRNINTVVPDALNAIGTTPGENGLEGVRCMWTTDRMVVVGTSAGIVKTWTATAIEDRLKDNLRTSRKSVKNAKRVPGAFFASPKQEAFLELKAELREHYQAVNQARVLDALHDRQSAKINGFGTREGWTDEELLGYAMIMSLEDPGLPPRTPGDSHDYEDSLSGRPSRKLQTQSAATLSAPVGPVSIGYRSGPSECASSSPGVDSKISPRLSPKVDASSSSSPHGTRDQWAMLGAAALSSSPGGSASSLGKARSNSKVSITTIQEHQHLQQLASSPSNFRKLVSADSWELASEDDSISDADGLQSSCRNGSNGKVRGGKKKKAKVLSSETSHPPDEDDDELQFALQLSLREM
ncbi:hypothetical protein HDU93_008162 [Gonapodya sp. JEL0774]|nr:hypothetical protein HDU93_008162 [Gonapodya sp. JEL0774]